MALTWAILVVMDCRGDRVLMGSGRQEGSSRNGQTSGVPSASYWQPIPDLVVLCYSLLAILVDAASARYSVVVQTMVAMEKMVAAPVYM